MSVKNCLFYGAVMGWLRCKLNLLRSAIMCICGSRSSLQCPVAGALIDVHVAEAPHFCLLVICIVILYLFVIVIKKSNAHCTK